jgi:DNA-binding transcriptional ArsR family regulator
MPIILHFETLRADQIGFGFSPAQEAVVSLHVLADVSHHPLHIPWVLQTRKTLSQGLKNELDAFSVLYQRRIASFWEPLPGAAFPIFTDELNALVNDSIDTYIESYMSILLTGRFKLADLQRDSSLQQQIIDAAAGQAPQSVAVVREVLDNPVSSRQRFCDLLSEYWDACLEAEWPRLEAAFYSDIESRGRILLQRGVLGLLSTLSPELHINFQTGQGLRKGEVEGNIEFGGGDMLFLVPSYFVWPHVLTKMTQPVHLKYAIQEHWSQGQAPIPPERILKLMRATGDLTRLQILQLISQQERSTRELAGIIGISEAAISKHLRLLQEVELIAPRRDSYFVFYHLVGDTWNYFASGVMHLLDTSEGIALLTP